MDLNLVIDPAINKEKLLQYNPPAALILGAVETTQLTVMPVPFSIEEIDFIKHIGDLSDYPHKLELIQSLKLIKHRLDNGFNKQLGELSVNDKQIILAKLQEGAPFCTAGFHDRVQEIILSWSRPSNLLQLLHQARESLVIKAAAEATDNVHASNLFFSIACIYNLGVRPRYEKDIYPGHLDVDQILEQLKQTFERHLTPFGLIQMIADTLQAALADCYHDYYEQGYNIGDYDAILSRLNQLLSITNKKLQLKLEDCFLIEEKEENGILIPRCVAIQWDYIHQIILRQLKSCGIFTIIPLEPITLHDFSAYLQLSPSVLKNTPYFLHYLTKFLKNTEHFKDLIRPLNNTQKDAVFDACIPLLLKTIKNAKHFNEAIRYLNTKQIDQLCEKDRYLLPNLIQCFKNIQEVFHDLNAAQIKAVCKRISYRLPLHIRKGLHFKKLIEELNEEQKTAILNACIPFLPQFIQRTSDFNQVLEHLNEQQRTIVFEKCMPLTNLIKSTSDFKEILEYLNPDLRRAVCETSLPMLPTLIENVSDMPQILEPLDTQQRNILCRTISARLPHIINDTSHFKELMGYLMIYLNEEQKTILSNACIPHLFKIIKHVDDLKWVLAYLSAIEIKEICGMFGTDLSHIIESGSIFKHLLKKLNSEQRKSVYEACTPFLPNLLKNAHDFKEALKYLSPDLRREACNASLDLLPSIVQSVQHFQDVLKYLGRKERTIVCSTISGHLPSIVKTGSDFSQLMEQLNETQREIVFEACVPLVVKLIQNSDDFAQIMEQLTNKQRTKVCIDCIDILPRLLETPSGFKTVFKYINHPQQKAIAPYLSEIVQRDKNFFKNIIRYLCNGEGLQRPNVLTTFFPIIVKNPSDFCNFLSSFNAQQIKVIGKICLHFLPEIIKTVSDLKRFLNHLKQSQVTAVISTLSSFIFNFIHNANDLNQIIRELDHAQTISMILSALASSLPDIIDSIDNFYTCLNGLSEKHKNLVFNLLIPVLLETVKQPLDFKRILSNLDDAQQNFVCQMQLPFLTNTIKNTDDFEDFILSLNKKQRFKVCRANPSLLPTVIKNSHDLNPILQHFEFEQAQYIYSLLSPHLSNIIKDDRDLDNCRDFIAHLSFDNKIDLLRKLKKDCLEPYLARQLSGKNAFKSFFTAITPEDVLIWHTSYTTKTHFQKSLAAYALLKEQEQKAPTEKEAYYSKPMWKHLKNLAKGFFNGENVGKIHRRPPRSISSFFSCKSTPNKTPLYAGDMTLAIILPKK